MKSIVLFGLIVSLCALGGLPAQEKKEPPKIKYGFKVGEGMPFHVVDFIAGVREKGAGCPSVMISNARSRGLEIWTRSNDEQAFQLTAALQTKLGDGKKTQGFLLLFHRADKDVLVAKANQHGLKQIHVSVPRSIEKSIFQAADASGKSEVIVFFLDHKIIRASWSFAAGELTKERTEALVKAADTFLAEKK
jgi:hypothetical protein